MILQNPLIGLKLVSIPMGLSNNPGWKAAVIGSERLDRFLHIFKNKTNRVGLLDVWDQKEKE